MPARHFAIALSALLVAAPAAAQSPKPVATTSAVAGTVAKAPVRAQVSAPLKSIAAAPAKAGATVPAKSTTAALLKPVAKAPARSIAKAPAKSPVAAIEDRGANPRGPFAKLTEPQRDSIIANARGLLGIKYKWAGETPERGVDCSGLIRYVFAKLGIDLPHSSAELAKLGGTVEVDTAAMRPGDLLVFSRPQSKRISHVAMYVGDGMMIHASAEKHQVWETPVMEYNLVKLRGVRRVIAVDSAATEAPPGSLGIKN